MASIAFIIYEILTQALEGKRGATEITQSPYLTYSDISTSYSTSTLSIQLQCQQREER
jgi:hypothetical protein